MAGIENLDPDEIISKEVLECMSHKQLLDQLKCRNLKVTGTKDAKVNRLSQYMTGDRSGTKIAKTPKVKKTHNEQYCLVPGCKNVAGLLLPDGSVVTMHRIPCGEKKQETRRKWISSIKKVRKDTSVIEQPNTRICCEHFPDNIVHADSVPDHFPTANKPRKDVKPRRCLTRVVVQDENYSSLIPVADDVENNIAGLTRLSDESTQSELSQVVPEIISEISGPQTVTIGTQAGSTEFVKFSDASVQTVRPDISPEDLEFDDKKTRFYTGFVHFKMFMLMFNTLVEHGAQTLNYWGGQKRSNKEKIYYKEENKPGPKRRLRPIDEFLLVCMRLRLGILQEHLADIFKLKQSTISKILTTWINFMYDHSKSLIKIPTPSQLRNNVPSAFQDFQNCQMILDCTEFFCEKPSSLLAQWQTWSEYKHHNTFKVLIGVTPNGMVSYISRLWGGRASDRHITQNDELILKLHPGMAIMADKGFTVDDLLPPTIDLNIPPRIPSSRPMTEREFFQTSHIASARIVVEMKMEEIKNYRVLQGILPLSEAHLAEQMVFLCAAWTNFNPPLLK